MIAALISGSLFRAPEQRTSKTGKPFVSATISCQDGGESRFVRLFAFAQTVQEELLRLADGDALNAQGKLSISIYTGRDGNAKIGLSIVADHVLALRQPPHERKTKPRQERCTGTWAADSGDPNDPIPF